MTRACSLSDSLRGANGRLPRLGLLLALTFAPRITSAQVPPAAPTPPAPPREADDDDSPEPDTDKHKKHKRTLDAADEPDNADKADKPKRHDVQLKGRVLALIELSHRHETIVGGDGQLEERNRDALDLSLQSARFGVEYRSPLRWISGQVELEVAGKPRVKDAFVEAGKRFFVKAGQFKVPSARLELDSPWTLPLARRGLLHDLMTDWLDIAGRRP